MAERTFGKITIVGTVTECKLGFDAFHEGTPARPLSAPIEELLGDTLRIEHHTPKEFVDAGRIIPGSKSPSFPKGRAAWGYRVSDRVLWGNSKVATRFPVRMRHVYRHEAGHDFDGDYLAKSPQKRTDIMAECLANQEGKHPTQWNPSAYEDASEGFADAFAIAISGKDGFYNYEVELIPGKEARLLEILFRTAVPVPNPEPPPPPPPTPPVDPELIRLQNLLKEIGEDATAIVNKTKG